MSESLLSPLESITLKNLVFIPYGNRGFVRGIFYAFSLGRAFFKNFSQNA